MNVADEVKEPGERNGLFLRVWIACGDVPVARQCRQYVWNSGWLNLYVRRLATGFERYVDVVPWSTVLALIHRTAFVLDIPGHMLSAAIAYQILQQENPATIDKVKAALALHPWHSTRWQNLFAPFAGADADVMLFMLAARWADDIRTGNSTTTRAATIRMLLIR